MQNSTPGSKRCLVITEQPLTNLRLRRHGVYQRLRMGMEALRLAGYELDIACMLDPAEPAATLAEVSAAIEQQLTAQWGLQARVVAVSSRLADKKTPYILQQLAAVLSYKLGTGMRAARSAGRVDDLAKALAHKPDIVYAHRLTSMVHFMSVKLTQRPPSFLDLDDVEHVVQYRAAIRSTSARDKWIWLAAMPALVWAEATALRLARKTFICSEADAVHLQRLMRVPASQVSVVPNGVSVPPIDLKPTACALLMVGIFSYEPNSEGAQYFIEHIWPLVRAAEPAAELWLVGASPESIPAHASQPVGVHFMGFVDDLDAVYQQSRAVVCPILFGGGTRVKLVEAAVRAKPIVTTTVGGEGLGLVDGEHALVRDTPQAFADACVELLRNPERAQQLGLNVRQLAVQKYDRAGIIAHMARQF
jgi:glycosyltransferase involved in cell wall biosynthesis